MRLGVFPFGEPVLPVFQRERSRKRVFVLGVYASAVHARWIGADGRTRISAVAVASEPEIFWRGGAESAQSIIDRIALPRGAGRLVSAQAGLNGPSGVALDAMYLEPLGLTRSDAWLCDLVPHSCMNSRQACALERSYDPVRASLGLPDYDWPRVPAVLATEARRQEIESELIESGADIVMTLGDQPLKWFTRHFGSAGKLGRYGRTPAEYGRLHPFRVGGREMQLLPLAHPRQAGRLGAHSSTWAELHADWVAKAPEFLRAICRGNG